MKVSKLIPLVTFLCSFFALPAQDTLESKGAIIIASLEGQVSVINNETQAPLPASQVKAGGLLVDGHTVKTGPASKVILLLSNGTISTIKAETSLNIKKFTQAKFDAKGKKLSEMEGEPSASETVLDLQLGDMVLDVKKLDKSSSFNIESPVGTAGIRGTIPYLQVMETKDGGFNQTTSMLEGELAFTPKGSDKPILLGPGDSLTLGILPNGVMIPPTFKTLTIDMRNAIESDTQNYLKDDDSPAPVRRAGEVEPTDEAEQQEQKNDSDAGRSARSAGADNNGSAALGAMAEQGLISATDENALVAVDAINAAGDLFVEKTTAESETSNPNASQRYRRSNHDGEQGKSSEDFVTNLVGNFGDVVEVSAEAEELGLKNQEMFDSLLENSENSGAVKEVVAVAAEVGIKSKENLSTLFTSVDQADSVAKVTKAAKDVDSGDAATLGAAFRSADQGDKLAAVVEESNQQVDGGAKSKKLNSLFTVVKKVDAKKEARKVKQAQANSAPQTLTQDIKDIIDEFTTVAEINEYLSKNSNDPLFAEINDYASLKIDEVSISNSFDQISNVVKVVEVFEDIKQAGGNDVGEDVLDGVLTFSEQAESLVDVVEAGKQLGATKNLGAVLAKPERASDFKKVTQTVSKDDVDATASLTLFENIEAVTDVVVVAESKGKSNANLIKNVAKNANVAVEMKSAVETIDDLGDGADTDSLFTNIVEVGNIVKTAKDNGQDNTDFIKNVAGNANIAKEMKAAADQLEELGDDADAASLFTNIVDVGNIVKTAKDNGQDNTDFIKNVAGNANIAKEMKAAADQLEELGDDADAASLFSNIVDVGKVVQKAQENNSADASVIQKIAKSAKNAKTMVQVAETADLSQELFDNIDDVAEAVAEAGSDVANDDFIKNIAKAPEKAKNVTNVFKKAKEAGVEDVSLLQNIAANTEQAEKMDKVFETLGGENIDPDAAKNILGNAAEIDVIDKALDNAKKAGKAGDDLAAFAAKDISEQKAVNELVEDLGDNADAFLSESFDDALVVKQALDDGVLNTSDIGSGKSLSQQLKDNSLISLAKRFGFVADVDSEIQSISPDRNAEPNVNGVVFEELFTELSSRSDDLLFALNFVEVGSSQESSLLANADKLDSIMYLSNRFRPIEITDQLSPSEADRISNTNAINSSRLNAIYNNLDVVDSLQELVFELSVFPDRLDIVFQNADLAPSILSTYREYEKGNQYLSIERMFSSSDSLITTLSNDGINKLLDRYPSYTDEIEANAEIAAEISSLVELVGDERASMILSNLDDFDSIQTLVFRANNEEGQLNALFTSIENSPENTSVIQTVSNEIAKNNIPGGQDFLFDNLDKANILVENLADVPAIIDVSKKYYKSSEKMDVVFANAEKAGQLRDLAKNLSKQTDELLANINQLDVIEGLAGEYNNDANKMGVVFSNSDKASRILDISKKFSTKHEEILSAVDDLADVEALASRFENDADKIETLFDNVDRVADINTLADKFDDAASNGVEVKPEDILDNLDYLDDVLALDQQFEGEDGKLMNLYLNPEKAGSLRGLMDRYNEKADDLIFNLDSLDSILVLESKLDGNAENMDVVLSNPEKSNDLKNLADKLPGKEGELLDNIDQLDVIGELTETFNAESDKMDIVFENSSSASKLISLSKDLPNNADDLLENIEQLDVVEDLINDFNADPEKMLVVFKNPSKAKTLRDLIDDPSFEGQKDDLLSNIDNVDNFKREPRLLGFKKNHPKFFEMLEDVAEDLDIKPEDVEFDLLTQLVELSLSRDELHKVLSDLNIGPDSDGPSDQPPSDEGLDKEALAVTLLESHDFSGEIPSDLVISENQIRASSLFQETLDVFDALSEMDEPSSYTESSSSSAELPMGIIGGVNLKIGAGNYDLSDLGFLSYAFAASDSLRIDGQLSFTSTNSADELLFISAGTLELVQGSSIDFSGDSLGIGSFDSIEIIDVSLHSEGEIGVRSLDSIVINNSTFATRGTGADRIHLIAASELTADNLIFSEQVRQITMEAMTINLRNINFPDGSTVNLNSSYGGVDGVYPNFGSTAVGRVNFIENVKYNSHLLNNRSAFDQYGSSITIGVSSN